MAGDDVIMADIAVGAAAAPGEDETFDPTNEPSDSDIAAAIEVLRFLVRARPRNDDTADPEGESASLLARDRNDRFRAVRRLANQISMASLPNKKSLNRQQKKREEKIKKAWRRRTMMEQDQRHTAVSALRQGRMQALDCLCEVNNVGVGESALQALGVCPDGGLITREDVVPAMLDNLPAVMTSNSKQSGTIFDDPHNVASTTAESITSGSDVNDERDACSSVRVERSRSCYVCKVRYHELHHFYDALCPTCAALNWQKRHQSARLSPDFVALVTGGRVKIGFHVCLKLLHAGATVIVTSRFRNDALERFARQPDFHEFRGRLVLLGCDLRFLPRVEALCDFVCENFSHLDLLVHNACQTIRRPHAYYEPLRDKERNAAEFLSDLEAEISCREACQGCPDSIVSAASCSTTSLAMLPKQGVFYDYTFNAAAAQEDVALAKSNDWTTSSKPLGLDAAPTRQEQSLVPQETSDAQHQLHLQCRDDDSVQLGSEELPGRTDVNGQLIDYRDRNSWVMRLHEVETPELVECFLINAMAPFVMNGRLQALMESSPRLKRFIVNVSAMEGKFYRYKTPNHPHTNMAKAALNMMTKTSAPDLARNSGIWMNSVDTGWINDEKPVRQAFEHAQKSSWQTPIDEVDAAARILDPFFTWVEGVDGERLGVGAEVHEGERCPVGMFLKNFGSTEW